VKKVKKILQNPRLNISQARDQMAYILGEWGEVVLASITGAVMTRSDALSAVHRRQSFTATNARLNAPRVDATYHGTTGARPTLGAPRLHELTLWTRYTPTDRTQHDIQTTQRHIYILHLVAWWRNG